MYECVALEDILATKDSLLEGNMFTFDTPPPSDLQAPSRIGGFERHPKDPLTPWGSPRGLTQRCHGLVKGIYQGLWKGINGQPPLQQLINLHQNPEGVVLVELFARLSTGLATMLEAELAVHTYVYVHNNGMVSKAAKHHIKQLRARYQRQLPTSAMKDCMSQLPHDIALIGEDNLHRLGRVDIVIAGWPC